MEFVVDFQGFKRPFNEFVFKEVAVVALEDDALPSVYLFEPPHRWSYLPAKYQSENLWLEKNYHGLTWNSGNVPYEEVHEVLINILRDASKVHVKGYEKKRWLEKILPDVYNLDDLTCPSLRQLTANTTISCTNHQRARNPSHCAVYNACALKTWLLEWQKQQVNFASTECIPDTSTTTTTLKDYYEQSLHFKM